MKKTIISSKFLKRQQMEKRWKSLNNTSKENKIIDAVCLIEDVFKLYTDMELRRISCLISAIQINKHRNLE